MNSFSEHLLSRASQIRQVMPASASDPHAWLASELLNVPSAVADMETMEYTISQSPVTTIVDVTPTYARQRCGTPTFLVRDAFELTCAMSMGLRMHLPVIDIVIDNRSGFVSSSDFGESFYGFATNLRNSLGEDLECAQAHGTQEQLRWLCRNNIIAYRLGIDYYEEPRLLNALSCVVAEHARATMDKVGNAPVAIMDALMDWFRENIRYQVTGSISDHSAVGLIVNGTSVCQGIAVYANQFLWHCGIPNRYVHGYGEGEPHGWNIVKVNGTWEHVDYTFALTDGRQHILSSSAPWRARFIESHTWDEVEYANWRNDWIANVKQSLGNSVISMIPNGNGYSVNGCVVDTTGSACLMRVIGGNVWVGIGTLSQLLGGGWGLRDDGRRLSVCFGGVVHSLDASSYRIMDGTSYMPADMLPRLGMDVRFGTNNVIHVQRRMS